VTALIDTNVILDVLLARAPHLTDSAAVVAAVETGRCRGLLCATTVTTIHYIARRQLGNDESLERLADLLSIFGVATVNEAVLRTAMKSGMPGFEDAVLHEAARQAGPNCIITRNIDDFIAAAIPVYLPAQFLTSLESGGT
jgi:predicted nucleic acid-binding protein